jgi:hypothetical protein
VQAVTKRWITREEDFGESETEWLRGAHDNTKSDE